MSVFSSYKINADLIFKGKVGECWDAFDPRDGHEEDPGGVLTDRLGADE